MLSFIRIKHQSNSFFCYNHSIFLSPFSIFFKSFSVLLHWLELELFDCSVSLCIKNFQVNLDLFFEILSSSELISKLSSIFSFCFFFIYLFLFSYIQVFTTTCLQTHPSPGLGNQRDNPSYRLLISKNPFPFKFPKWCHLNNLTILLSTLLSHQIFLVIAPYLRPMFLHANLIGPPLVPTS